ncbi:hypothetical protein E2C01_060060 [Portunus trituberculatus]|uniref:Uncharacterized protein n=1 Tax=Portunus trituberculatus TaxID=210409 RepID=A0A5B7H494_PORTR|nr:hypothetical protein [Portunus trituberculatus]
MRGSEEAAGEEEERELSLTESWRHDLETCLSSKHYHYHHHRRRCCLVLRSSTQLTTPASHGICDPDITGTENTATASCFILQRHGVSQSANFMEPTSE